MAQRVVRVSVGGDVTLECQATGIPPPLVHWFKGKLRLKKHVQIRANEDISTRRTLGLFFVCVPGELEVGSAPFVEQDEHRGTLHIRGVQEVDAGQYSCVARSSAGTSAGNVSLEVGGETARWCSTESLFFVSICKEKKGKFTLPPQRVHCSPRNRLTLQPA